VHAVVCTSVRCGRYAEDKFFLIPSSECFRIAVDNGITSSSRTSKLTSNHANAHPKGSRLIKATHNQGHPNGTSFACGKPNAIKTDGGLRVLHSAERRGEIAAAAEASHVKATLEFIFFKKHRRTKRWV
jgi:hypothetical protein